MKLNAIKIFTVIVVSLLFGCASDPLIVDVSDQNVEVNLKRMEQELSIDSGSVKEAKELSDKLLSEYGVLYELYITKFLQEGSAHDPMIGEYLMRRGQTDPLMIEVLPKIQSKFADFSTHKAAIEEGLKHCKYYFPDSSLPDNIVTFFSYFNAPAMVVNNDLCISIEMYLGPEDESVLKLPIQDFPQFFKNKLDEKYLVGNAMKAWLLERFYNHTGNELLDKMIAAGKIMYLMDATLPEVSDEIKMGYSEKEIQWAQTNEVMVWEQMVVQEILYSKDDVLEASWINDGPNTKGLPGDSPSKMGVWMGWQMVKDFMIANPATTLTDLVNEPNAKRILKHYDSKN
jgi:hypothetical protein